MLKVLLAAVLLAGMTGCTKEELPASAERITLVLDGSPRAAIVIPDSAGKTERFAAEELQKYVERISGARLDITKEGAREAVEGQDPEISRVFVGNTRSAAPLRERLSGRDTDSFLVQGVGREGNGRDLFLTGAEERGTLWAVYDFLERELGCRWLAPGELWEIVPQRESIEIPVRARVEEPGLKYRIGNLGRGGTYSDLSLWTLKHKENVTRSIHLPIEGMSAGYHEQEPLPIEPRGWRSWHSIRAFRDSFGLEYPEWFAVDGEGERPGQGQMCFVNPELRDYLAERFSRILREKPELDFVELGPCDMLFVNYCRCEGCLDLDILGAEPRGRRGGHTHRWLAVVNAVAGYMAETDPDRYLLATAYSSYQEPPDPDVIVPAENVMIKIATWEGCRSHGYEYGLDNDDLPEARIERHARHRGWMDVWEDITPAGMMMSEYVGRSAMDGMAGTNPRRYVADIRHIRDRGWKGYWGFGEAADMGLRMVNDYAIARALWNPDIDPDELVRDFCDHAFGAASEHMQRFIHVIQDGYEAGDCSNGGGTAWMLPDTVSAARRHLDAALEAAADDEEAMLRLRAFEVHFQYMVLAEPASHLRWRVRQERDPELMREAIRKGRAAIAYRREMAEKYDMRFHAGWRLGPYVRKGGAWEQELKRLER